MRVQSEQIIQLFTLIDGLVNQLRKLLYLAFLLFEVTKPAGSLDSSDLPTDIRLQIFNALFIA